MGRLLSVFCVVGWACGGGGGAFDAGAEPVDGGGSDSGRSSDSGVDAGPDAAAVDGGGACVDRDRDGHDWERCGGDDCDDTDARIHPGAAPICTGLVRDADCDGTTDITQDACDRTSPVCESAATLELGVERVFLTSSDGSCLDDDAEFFHFELAELSDLSVTVRVLYDEEADPETIGSHEYAAFLRDGCDAAESRFPGQACSQFTPSSDFYPGSPSRRYDAASVAPGSHLLEIRGSVFAPSSSVLGMAVTVEATPALLPDCAASAELVSTALGITDGADAFRYTCAHFLGGPPVFVDAPERIHRLVVSERERWRVMARSDSAPLRISLHGTCDPGAPPRGCVRATAGCNVRTLDAILDPGEYFLRVEGRSGGEHSYELEVRREPPGASCIGAPVISVSGTFAGDTTGATDDFRASEPCADASGPDDVWRIDVMTAGYFAADLDFGESFSNAYLTLRDECGGEPIRQHNAGVSWSVEPGTYYLTVDGYEPTDFGAYQIEITMPTP